MRVNRTTKRKIDFLLSNMKTGLVYGLTELGRAWGDEEAPGMTMNYTLKRMVSLGLVEKTRHELTGRNGYRLMENGRATQEL